MLEIITIQKILKIKQKAKVIKYAKIEVKVIQKIKKGINQIKNIMIIIIYI